MSSNDIGTNVIFKKQLGLNYEIEPILVDIGGTGDIKCDFKGLSPVLKNNDELDQYFISATLQEDKQYDPLEEEKCETCSGCGFH